MFHPLNSIRSCLLLLSAAILLLTATNRVSAARATSAEDRSDPSNIHAIIVSSSRYWFNYRHAINALGIYEIYQRNGIPDENIILSTFVGFHRGRFFSITSVTQTAVCLLFITCANFLYLCFHSFSTPVIADEYAINARNPYKNRMHSEGIHLTGWYTNETEIDYRGSDVTVQMFMDALLGTAPKSLNLNAESNLLIYVTGHGGDQFFKFQDEEELMAQDISNLMDKLYEEKRFGKALFIADTCQAFTLFDKVTTPNVMALGTSLIDESAYAHHSKLSFRVEINFIFVRGSFYPHIW